jgi:hypothetical protein
LVLVPVLAWPGGSRADGGSMMEIEGFENAPADAGAAPLTVQLPTLATFEASPGEVVSVKFYGFAAGALSVDSRFDSPRGAPLGENVAEGRLRAQVGLDAKLSSRLRVVVEGRAQVRLTTQRDFDRAKGFFEPMLGDAYLDVYSPSVDLRVGNQRIALGANAALAPADVLNPKDLRESLLSGEPEDAVLPVFALRAQGEFKGFSWLAAYAPFFTPSRYAVFGQDEALLQPGLGPSLDTTRIDPSIEDQLQDRLLETKRPPPFAGDVALHLLRNGPVKVGVSWVWANEKLPRFRLDKELSSLLASQAAGRALDSAKAVSVLNRFQAGQTLVTGTYARTHIFSLEGSTLLGPGQLDVDLAFSPRATYIDAGFNPIDKASLTWVVGYSQAAQGKVFWSVAYLGVAVPNVGANEQLIVLEPATAVGGARTAIVHVFSGIVSVPLLDDQLEVSLRAAFEPIQLSLAAGPRVTWVGFDKLKLWISGEIFVGAAWTPFGYFGRNSKVLAGARVDF